MDQFLSLANSFHFAQKRKDFCIESNNKDAEISVQKIKPIQNALKQKLKLNFKCRPVLKDLTTKQNQSISFDMKKI